LTGEVILHSKKSVSGRGRLREKIWGDLREGPLFFASLIGGTSKIGGIKEKGYSIRKKIISLFYYVFRAGIRRKWDKNNS